MKKLTIRNLFGSIVSSTLFLVLVLAFQNCSPVDFENKESAPPVRQSENGTGYGGKVYVAYQVYSPCGDGTNVESRLTTLSRTQGIIDRRDCRNIAPELVDLTSSDAVAYFSNRAENPFDLYTLQERVFETLPPVPYVGRSYIDYACHGRQRDVASGVDRYTRIVVSANPDDLSGFNRYATIMSSLGSVPTSGSEDLVPGLSSTYDAAAQTKYMTDATREHELTLDYSTYPRPATVTGSGVGFTQNNLSCYSQY